MGRAKTLADVLTLDQLADYLQLSRDETERLATGGQVPGRRIGPNWRFLKAAIDDWLRGSDSGAEPYDGRAILLRQAGQFANDPTLSAMRAAIYAERGRPEGEAEQGLP